jgi:hypothetical protein
MRSRVVTAGLLALMLALGRPAPAQPASAASQLGVGAVVRPSRPAPRALASLPLPPGSRAMGETPFGGSYAFPGSVPDAVEFFRTAMHGHGYRLVGEQQGAGQTRLVWQRDGERVELECRAVFGVAPATRIVVVASAMREG